MPADNFPFTSSFANLPPRVAGTDPDYQVNSAASAVTASSANLWANYTADPSGNTTPSGKLYIEMEAVGFDCFVRFSRTATTSTTNANGSICRVGTPRLFYVDPSKDLFLDYISPGGAGTIKWRKVSTIGERNRA